MEHYKDNNPNPRLSMLQSLQTFAHYLPYSPKWGYPDVGCKLSCVRCWHRPLPAYMLSHCLLFSCGIPSHASTSSSGRHIDFIHGTPLLLSAVRRGRSLSFHQSPHSDCRVLYVDLDEKILFQDSSTDTTAPSHRLLRLSNPGPCAKYLGAVNEYLT